MKQITKLLITSTVCTLLTACNGFFDKDNTPIPAPLVTFKPEFTPRLLWDTKTNSGTGSDFADLMPAISHDAIFTADKRGVITASNKFNGKMLWKVTVQTPVTSGPVVHDGLLFVGTRNGKIIALEQQQGGILWQTQVSSEVLAPPTAGHGVVLAKSIDGELTAISERTGRILWRYQQTSPTIILREASAPQIYRHDAIVGFENGNLLKLTLNEGSLLWQRTIAKPEGSFAIQRMVDIDADPIITNNSIYVATYQGKIACLDLDGKEKWTHDLSSYTGLVVDKQKVYVTDATSYVWAFDARSGAVHWRQRQLQDRNITAPVFMYNTLLVGDAEGYLHWLDKQDGHFVARIKVSRSPLRAAPVVDNNIAYVLTQDGHLSAYTLASL